MKKLLCNALLSCVFYSHLNGAENVIIIEKDLQEHFAELQTKIEERAVKCSDKKTKCCFEKWAQTLHYFVERHNELLNQEEVNNYIYSSVRDQEKLQQCVINFIKKAALKIVPLISKKLICRISSLKNYAIAKNKSKNKTLSKIKKLQIWSSKKNNFKHLCN